MIRIEHISVPSKFEARAREALDELSRTADAGGYKKQHRFKFDGAVWGTAVAVLQEHSHGKCMFCEQRTGVDLPGEIDHFRPRDRAQGLDRADIAPDHYWWLAYDWDNLVYSCLECNRSKGRRFPVDGRRLQPFEDQEKEPRLILSPYGPEDPADELMFHPDGQVRPVTWRGEITIEVLALNRPELVKRRAQVAGELHEILASEGESMDFQTLDELAAGHHEFAAMRRQIIADFGLEQTPEYVKQAHRVEQPLSYSAPDDLRSLWIESVEISNFGCFESLELDFAASESDEEPWIVLLGSNGVGKSTILKAIALTLADSTQRAMLVPDASRLLNRNVRDTKGSVKIRFNTGEYRELIIRRGESEFAGQGMTSGSNLVGYGSTRLLPGSTRRGGQTAVGPRLSNLFDPWEPLADAEPWLADPDRVSADDFRVLASTLRILLSGETEVELSRYRRHLRAKVFGQTLGLNELSDGYQSILALALDLSMAFGGDRAQGFSTDNYEGLVLLDELEVHLHPEWKQTVVSDLRSVFPRLQFVATTHDPLCLRGLLPGEIHHLERDEDDLITVEQIDVPPGLDADEILTGEWFNLDSTLDRETEGLLLEYRRLRLQGISPESEHLQTLRTRLEKTLGSYSGTSIGRVMVEAAGEVLAEQQSSQHEVRLSKDQIKQRLLEHARSVPR